MKPMVILASMFFALTGTQTFAQDVPPLEEEEFLVNEEGTPTEYTAPLNETDMEKADLERQEDILLPDDANTDWNMDDVDPEENF